MFARTPTSGESSPPSGRTKRPAIVPHRMRIRRKREAMPLSPTECPDRLAPLHDSEWPALAQPPIWEPDVLSFSRFVRACQPASGRVGPPRYAYEPELATLPTNIFVNGRGLGADRLVYICACAAN